MRAMIVVDVGNTSLHIAQVREGRIQASMAFDSATLTQAQVRKMLSVYQDGCVILVCSVVPRITNFFIHLVREKKFRNRILIAGIDMQVPLECHYESKSVGMDRLVAAFASRKLYPASRFILDFGTAITFDILSKTGSYEGGFILPGIGSTLKVFSGCAMLPKRIILKHRQRPSAFGVPRQTKESIQRGVEEGFSGMVNALIVKYRVQLKVSSKSRVVITGGDASSILPYLKFPYAYEPQLIFKGLICLFISSDRERHLKF